MLLLQAVDHLESFIVDCDRRTELAKKRLAETQEEISAEVAAKVNDATFLCFIKSGFPYATSSEPCQCVFLLNITCCLLCWCGCFVGREGA